MWKYTAVYFCLYFETKYDWAKVNQQSHRYKVTIKYECNVHLKSST